MEFIDPNWISYIDSFEEMDNFKDFLIRLFNNEYSTPSLHGSRHSGLDYDGKYYIRLAEKIKSKGLPNKIIIPMHSKEGILLTYENYEGIEIEYKQTDSKGCTFIWLNNLDTENGL